MLGFLSELQHNKDDKLAGEVLSASISLVRCQNIPSLSRRRIPHNANSILGHTASWSEIPCQSRFHLFTRMPSCRFEPRCMHQPWYLTNLEAKATPRMPVVKHVCIKHITKHIHTYSRTPTLFKPAGQQRQRSHQTVEKVIIYTYIYRGETILARKKNPREQKKSSRGSFRGL